MVIQMSLFESVLGLLILRPLYFLGFGVLGLALFYLFLQDRTLPKPRVIISSVLMYYYLGVLLSNIVGAPTLREFLRLTQLGEPIFNPNLSLTPFVNEPGLEFALNVLLFIPLGFLCPVMSYRHRRLRRMVVLGFGFSLAIEISQLFTRHRVSDINDLIANTLGAVIGYLCFVLIARFFKDRALGEADLTGFLPIGVIGLAFVFRFIA